MLTSERSWSRSPSMDQEVILLDGLTGTGKTMLMKVIDRFNNVLAPRFDYQLEQLCIGIYEKKIEVNAGIQLLSLLIDQRKYDSLISREINFRPADLSSVFRSNKKFSYFFNLFRSDQRLNLESEWVAKKKNLFVVHQLLDASEVISRIPNVKVKRILAVRHPYYLFDHWVSYVDSHGNSLKDFTVMIEACGQFPWFISSNWAKFIAKSPQEKAVVSIAEIMKRQRDYIARNKDVVVIDFERFVLEPIPYIDRIKKLIFEDHKSVKRVLKESNLPRKHINDGKKMSIYNKYGSQNLKTSYDHKSDYELLRDRIRDVVPKGTFELLELEVNSYESEFGLWF